MRSFDLPVSQPISKSNEKRRNSLASPSVSTFSTNKPSTPEIAARSVYRNYVPPPVLIDGYPSLRVCFRNTCLYRRRAQLPTLEWQSHYFFQHIADTNPRTELQTSLTKDGFIIIPDTLFGAIPFEEEHTLHPLLSEFFERYALPKQPLPTFADFIDPLTKILDSKRISWWKTLADYLHIPHYLDKILNTDPGNWHIVYHSLPSFSAIREFSEVIESLGLKRAREMIHQELARRIALIKGKGKIRVTTQFQLVKMGYDELREMSKKYDHLAGDKVTVEKAMESCVMCCVRPAFTGDMMTRS
jgi:hypothetical protein